MENNTSLFLSKFGMKMHPFATSPDPRFFVKTESHIDSLAMLIYSIRERKGFISLTGEVGTGKTTLLNTLLSSLDSNIIFSHITYSDLNFLELLQMICADFGLDIKKKSKVILMNELFHFVVKQRLKGKNALVIIDEVQNLSDGTLESLRMLSNVETTREKLVQILMCGQPEFKAKLHQKRLRQLAQRIVVNIELKALNEAEVVNYIYHRLGIAGAHGESIFPGEVARRIAFVSRGIPRIINILCDNCLLEVFLEDSTEVSPKTLLRAEARYFNIYTPDPEESLHGENISDDKFPEQQQQESATVEAEMPETAKNDIDSYLENNKLGPITIITLVILSILILSLMFFPDLLSGLWGETGR